MASRKTTSTIARPAATGSEPLREELANDNRLDEALLDHTRVRAYYLFLERNGGAGDATADWLRAERDLLGGFTH